MRNLFDREMNHLHTMMIEMGALCESAIASALKALLEQDADNARRAIQVEEETNSREREIEALCLKLLLRQQPVASDLRQISSVLKMVTDMERIGDQAADIAEIALLGNVHQGDPSFALKEMGIAAINMVTDSVDAYVAQDAALAQKVIDADDLVDDLFDVTRNELTTALSVQPARAEYVIDLLMVSKYIERIADHAVNIAEWVLFAVTGVHPQEAAGHAKGDANDHLSG